MVGIVTASVALLFAVIAGWDTFTTETTAAPVTTAPSPSVTPFDEGYATSLADAGALEVIDPAVSIPEYRRDSFGERWADVDGNGCDQRQDVLLRDLVDVRVDRCTVLSGTLDPDPYTGQRIQFWHDRVAPAGDPGSVGVQIDHLVSLAAAHRGGAWAWTPAQRELFANDLEQLRAVNGPTNQSKSDKGPGRWLPENPSSRCSYSADYVSIASRWKIAVDSEDKTALVTELTICSEHLGR